MCSCERGSHVCLLMSELALGGGLFLMSEVALYAFPSERHQLGRVGPVRRATRDGDSHLP